MDSRLLELLVCPVSQGALVYKPQQQELWSKAAGLAYAIKNGMPVMLPEEARSLSQAELAQL